jgi:hypothetical protein
MDWIMDWTMDWTMDDFYLATAVSTNPVSKFSLRLSLCHYRYFIKLLNIYIRR